MTSFSAVTFVFVLLRFRLYAFVQATALRSIVLRCAGAPIATRVPFFLLIIWRYRLFRVFSYHCRFLLVWRVSVLCACLFLPFILDIKFVTRTSRGRKGRSHINFRTPSFCGAWLNFSREKDSAIPFPRRP